MKQRFSSLDVKVIAHELSASLVPLRLSNIYDLSSKILLFKFAKPDVKKQLLIDSGFRCHLTDFARTTAAAPSVFVQKLRKALKTRRVTKVSQIGTDRIIEFQFSDGQYRLYLEFFASGNVILTDGELKILTLLRNVSEGEGQEPQRPGLTYSLENRQNYPSTPDLTKERVRGALAAIVERNTSAANAATAAGKKIKKKPGDDLRKGLAVTITELPPILVDHAMKVTGFDSTSAPAVVLESDEQIEHLLRSLAEARKIVGDITNSASCKGYILAKRKPGPPTEDAEPPNGSQERSSGLLYEDFHPFLPRQFEEDPNYTVLTFDNFNKTVDEFFSSIEGQKLESRLNERETAAKKKLESARRDQAKRIEGLQEFQTLNVRKAAAIQANIERVEEAIDAVNGLIAQGMDWVDIGKLIQREQKRSNPVANIIKLPLKLEENSITLLLGEAEEQDDDDEGYDTSSESDESDAETSKQDIQDKRLPIEIDLGMSAWANAGDYYGEKKSAAVKQQKTIQQSEVALKNAEQKIAAQLKKDLKQEKPVLQPVRKQIWFEKFIWFISSDGYLVLGGKDAPQNEILYRRYLKKGDVYVHADLHGAPSVVIKNNPQTPDAPIPPTTLSQAGSLAVCCSTAWDSKMVTSAYWVNADQVSKSAPTGEFLPTGSFMVRGKKNFLPPSQLLLGFGLIFRISEESKAKHVKHRLQYEIHEGSRDSARGSQTTTEVPSANMSVSSTAVPSEAGDNHPAQDDAELEASSKEDDEAVELGEDEDEQRGNPLQGAGDDREDDSGQEAEPPSATQMRDLTISDASARQASTEIHDQDDKARNDDGISEAESIPSTSANPSAGRSAVQSGISTPASQSQKKQPPKRGQRGKAKKLAKYRDQDEEERIAVEALIGATAGQKKKEADAKARAEREAAQEAAKERRRAQHQRQQRETAEHEEVRRMMLEEGLETLDADEAGQVTELDSLVGTPLPGDEILEVIPVCAPYAAMGKCKYKAKMQPGTLKKGKAVKEILESWRIASGKKGVVDERALDKERMWPREVELLKALKPEEVFNAVPVGKLRVMMAGGSGGGGGGGGGGGKDQGKGKGKGGNNGGKGKRR